LAPTGRGSLNAKGMDYDKAGRRYVLVGTTGFVGDPLLVTRVKH
jgi:hypothetical protein